MSFFDHVKKLAAASREVKLPKRETKRAPGSNCDDGTSVGSKHGMNSGGTKRRRAQYMRAATKVKQTKRTKRVR